MNSSVRKMLEEKEKLRSAVCLIAIANLTFSLLEFYVARKVGSLSLLANSIDFLEIGFLNVLIVLAFNRSNDNRAKVGMFLSGIAIVPTLLFFITVGEKFHDLSATDPWSLALTGFGALNVSLTCTLLLGRFRSRTNKLSKMASVITRNSIFASIAIILAGQMTINSTSGWPDLIVGLVIGVINANAARRIWIAAKTRIK